MDVVSLSFPGHFFQTALSICSINRWYGPIDHHYVILDDLESGPWQDYHCDAETFLRTSCPDSNLVFIFTSDIPKLDQCLSGWWRQQIVKLTLDKILPGVAWLAVDGDVIFDSFCRYQNIVPISGCTCDGTGILDIFTENYVRSVLGSDQYRVKHQGSYYLTNPVPYRWLTAEFLQKLRHHVEQRFGNDFVDLHIGWFLDQTIVGMHDDMTKWNMSEWELIEIFRRYVLEQELEVVAVGNGYPLDCDTSMIQAPEGIYRHGYVRDSQMGKDWFHQQGLVVDDHLWNQSRAWIQQREPWRA